MFNLYGRDPFSLTTYISLPKLVLAFMVGLSVVKDQPENTFDATLSAVLALVIFCVAQQVYDRFRMHQTFVYLDKRLPVSDNGDGGLTLLCRDLVTVVINVSDSSDLLNQGVTAVLKGVHAEQASRRNAGTPATREDLVKAGRTAMEHWAKNLLDHSPTTHHGHM